MVLDAERSEVVAERQQPVVLPVVAHAAEDRALLGDDALVGLDARFRKLQRPVAVGHDVDDVLAHRRGGRPEHDAAEMFAEQHRVIVQHRERSRRVVDGVAVGARDVERAAMFPAARRLERRGDGDRVRTFAHRIERNGIPVDDRALRIGGRGRAERAAVDRHHVVVGCGKRLRAGGNRHVKRVHVGEVAAPVNLPAVHEDVEAGQVGDRSGWHVLAGDPLRIEQRRRARPGRHR